MMERCVRVAISGVTFTNAPQYHMLLEDAKGLVVRDLVIYVSVDDQKAILGARGLLDGAGLPIFPLNTDGCVALPLSFCVCVTLVLPWCHLVGEWQ